MAYVCGSEICIISPLMGYGSCKDLLNTHFAEGITLLFYVLFLKFSEPFTFTVLYI